MRVTVGIGGGWATAIEVAALPLPPGPVQASANVVGPDRAGDDSEPALARLPLQPPDAVQVVALVLLQVSCVAPPLMRLAGLAVSVTVGAGVVTVTVAEPVVVPPGPEQASENVVLPLRTALWALPLVALEPLQPPVALQVVALALLQVSWVVPPLSRLVGLAVSVTVGAGVVTVTVVEPVVLPPGPVHASEKVVLLLSAALCALPLVALEPLQPPEAVQLVALAVLQESWVVAPLEMLVGFALSVTVGAGVPLVGVVALAAADCADSFGLGAARS